MGLQNKGHNVTIYTLHHDPKHAFQESISDLKVCVLGNWLIPSSIKGRFHLPMTILRSYHLAFSLIIKNLLRSVDVIIVDQLSAVIPLFTLLNKPVFFYLHFPDFLLTTRSNAIKSSYRYLLDKIEICTTSIIIKSLEMADELACNSKYTANVCRSSMKLENLKIIYPCIKMEEYDKEIKVEDKVIKYLIK